MGKEMLQDAGPPNHLICKLNAGQRPVSREVHCFVDEHDTLVNDTPWSPSANRSVLAINSGSSSIKFGLFTLAPEPSALRRGTIDEAARATTVDQVLERVVDCLVAYPLAGVGHRIVHGG